MSAVSCVFLTISSCLPCYLGTIRSIWRAGLSCACRTVVQRQRGAESGESREPPHHRILHGQRSQRSKLDQRPDIQGGSVNLSRICQRMSIRSLRTSGETIHGSSGANNPETIDELQLLDIPGHSARSPGTSARGDIFWRSEIVGRVSSELTAAPTVNDQGPRRHIMVWAVCKI